ncbi:PH domain-containing protein [Aeribacillus alveayuensis]|jgi:putative membrane protein|uniref:Membrane protein n=1 Tax=Aeribacillus alveayuensis TaxID=279215 RepID=A0ABT9VRF7_9BACI|nr:putative membrane protein [Bacillus alveayuensis]
MSEARRLHPVSALIRLVKWLKEMIAIYVLIIIGSPDHRLYGIVAICAISLFIIISSILYWLKYTYRIEDNEFRVEYGVFIKKKRYVPIERIQTINISTGIIQRLFGLVKLQIETAGGAFEAEVELSAIRKSEAERIQQILHEKKKWLREEKEEGELGLEERVLSKESIYHISPKELFITAATSSGLGVILSIFAFLSQFDELFSLDSIFNLVIEKVEILTKEGIGAIIFVIVLLLIAAWILSMIGAVLKYGNFTVEMHDGQLIISRGLLEKRQVTVSLERIQAVRIVENPLRQFLGYATVHIDTAGSSEAASLLFPLIKKRDMKEKIESIMDVTIQEQLHKLPKRALRRFWLKDLLVVMIVIIPLCIFFRPWGYASLLLMPAVVVLGYYQFRDAGWKIIENELTLAYRILAKTTVMMKKKRIQSLKVHGSYFQRNLNLRTLISYVHSGVGLGRYAVVDIDVKDAKKIYNWLSKRDGDIS